MRFKKGQLSQEVFDVVVFDLEALKDCFFTKNRADFEEHFELLKGNLQDIFGKKKTTADKEAEE